MIDPFYWDAEVQARDLGMPASSVWAYVWTPEEVVASRGGVGKLLLKLRNLTIPEAIELSFRNSELRVFAGHTVKMLGQCIAEDSSTAWAIKVPFNSDGYILIEPWLTVVPIGPGPRAVALRRRLPDGQVVKWHQVLDNTWEPDGVLIENAMRVLDMQVRSIGRPKVGKDDRLDRLARAGLKWLSEHKYHAVEEIKISHLEEAVDLNVKKLMEGRPGRPSIRIGNVHRRMREMLESEPR